MGISLNGVALAATMLAKKRGFDPEVAAMAGVLHDLHAYKTGSYNEHEHKGSELAREILEELKFTNNLHNQGGDIANAISNNTY